MKRIFYYSGLALITCFLVVLTGCKKDSSESVPEMDINPDILDFSRNAQENSVHIYNRGGDVLSWILYNKEDWVVIEEITGEVLEDESMMLTVISDLSLLVRDSVYTDSVEFRSNGGRDFVFISAIADIVIPENGLYSGITSEDLPIEYKIEYNKIKDFHGDYWDEENIRQESFPLFGLLEYAENGSFAVINSNGFILTGVYDQDTKSITGQWNLNTLILGYSIQWQEIVE